MLRHVAFDTETFLIEPGIRAPRLVCLSWAEGDASGLYRAADGIDWFRRQAANPDVHLWGHNVCFDLGVLCAADPTLTPTVFALLEAGRVHDTMIWQMLYDISQGTFEFRVVDNKKVPAGRRLADLVMVHFNTYIAKGDDTWRMRYGQLVDLTLDKWPDAAFRYAVSDAEWTWRLAEKLRREAWEGQQPPTEVLQMRAAWALYLMGVYGVRTDPATVEEAAKAWQEELDQAKELLTQTGTLVGGTMKADVVAGFVEKFFAAQGKEPPKTGTGKIQATKDIFKEIIKQTDSSYFKAILAYKQAEKRLGNYLPRMRQASVTPFSPSWNVLVVSGRTSCGSPDDPGNLQNLPKYGPVRECYVPREGFYYCSTDADTAELRSLAEVQETLGFDSQLAKELRQGLDPHLSFAVQELLPDDKLGVPLYSYEQAEPLKKKDPKIRKARDFAKVWNFGGPGGLGAPGLATYAKAAYGIEMTVEQATDIRDRALQHYQELRRYFNWASNLTRNTGVCKSKHPITGFLRADMNYTALCNHMFQHLTACGAKEALWRVAVECYLGRSVDGTFKDGESPLFGSRPVMFVHDEIICEIPIGPKTHDAAFRQAELLCQGMREFIKKVPSTSSPALMRRLYKDAEAVYDTNGKLIPWEPKR